MISLCFRGYGVFDTASTRIWARIVEVGQGMTRTLLRRPDRTPRDCDVNRESFEFPFEDQFGCVRIAVHRRRHPNSEPASVNSVLSVALCQRGLAHRLVSARLLLESSPPLVDAPTSPHGTGKPTRRILRSFIDSEFHPTVRPCCVRDNLELDQDRPAEAETGLREALDIYPENHSAR